MEKIFVNYPRSIGLSTVNLSTVTKENLPSIIVLDNMGVWERIFQQYAPQTTIIKQNNRDTLNQIHRFSSIPFISSNIYTTVDQTDFTKVPIEDKHFQIKIYANYKDQSKERIQNIINNIKQKL